jgi:hypothetical protein
MPPWLSSILLDVVAPGLHSGDEERLRMPLDRWAPVILLLLAGCASSPSPSEWDFSTGRVRFTNLSNVLFNNVAVFISRADRTTQHNFASNANAQVRALNGAVVTRIEPKQQVEIVSPEADYLIRQGRPFTVYLMHEGPLPTMTVVGHYPPLR